MSKGESTNESDSDTDTTTASSSSSTAVSLVSLLMRQLEELSKQHGHCKSRSKNVLHFRHAEEEFVGDTLFDTFARAVCEANCVWRKELLEAWSVALYVHLHFPPGIARVVDCASGHGLLSWALLVLDDYSHKVGSTTTTTTRDDDNNHNQKKETNNDKPRLTAVCVDVKMPRAADKLAKAMVENFPQLSNSLDYVEAKLETILPSASTLIVGIHCCARLSDNVVQLALQGNSPVALVPCCHSKKSLEKEEKPLLHDITFDLAEYLDQKRMQSLRDASFHVQEAWLPSLIPPKNRIILATPKKSTATLSSTCFIQPQLSLPSTTSLLPPLVNPERLSWTPLRQRIVVPVADTPQDRAVVQSLAGRAAADARKKPPPPSICLSIFLPPDWLQDLTADELHSLLFGDHDNNNNNCTNSIVVQDIGKPPDFNKPKRIKTYRITYPSTMDMEQAKTIHREACHRLPIVLPGAIARHIPKS